MVLLGKIMILQGVGHQISCHGVCYVNDPKKGGYTTPAPALDLTTSLRGDSSPDPYMVCDEMYVSVSQWSSGICLGLKFIGGGSEARSPNKWAERNGQITETPQIGSIPGPPPFFCTFCHLSCEEKWVSLHNKACWKKMNAHRLPIPIELCAGWVCSRPCGSDLQPKLSCSSQSDGTLWQTLWQQ